MIPPKQIEIREAAKNKYGSGSYWQGVKTDAFREGAKWAIEFIKKINKNQPSQESDRDNSKVK